MDDANLAGDGATTTRPRTHAPDGSTDGPVGATVEHGGARSGVPQAAVPVALPFDAEIPVRAVPDDGDPDAAPIPFGLTARARRLIAPASLPDLAVVDARSGTVSPLEDDPADTRPARARALRRAGASTATIARELDADELLVRAWCAEVGGGRPVAAGSTPAVRHPARGRRPAATAEDTDEALEADRRAWEDERARVRDEVELRLADLDPLVAAAAGVVVALAEVTRYATTLVTADLDVVRHAIDFTTEECAVARAAFRVVLRHGQEVAGDRLVHEWRRRLDLDAGQVRTARWYEAPEPAAVQCLLRLPDGGAAARIAAWRDVLLSHERLTDPGAGVAF